jgi:glycosyltransferase involved in cell wall biosynthesis
VKIIKKTVLSETKRKSLPDNYFLVVSRLVSYKKVDLAIRSCNKLRLPLVVIGTGSEESRLKSLAGPTIQFRKNLTDEELAWYYQHSTALLMPQEEDFGLSGVEAQSFGKPVIAYKKGGANETVIAGKTGVFFTEQKVKALTETLQTFAPSDYNDTECMHNAERFSSENFKKAFLKYIV